MPRPEKVAAVSEIKERLEQARAVFLAEYAGLSVREQQALRRGLRDSGAEFKVVKMTLARRAAAELELNELDELLLGPTGLTFADSDPVMAAKALKEFADSHEVFSIKGGLLGSDFLTPERISDLAKIESREVLLSKIAGAAQAPMSKLAGLLAALPRNLASALQQLVEKREAAGETSAASADEADAIAADEAPDESPDSAESPASPDSPESPESPDSVDSPDASADDEAAAEATDGARSPEAEAEADAGDDDVSDDPSDTNDDEDAAATAEEE